ncbi:MAG: hypothetical protein L0Y68_04220 [Candidatus Dadabacteria bacterium]|nr:hypothetical protein [Candidatus Dadabacteria bacterium]
MSIHARRIINRSKSSLRDKVTNVWFCDGMGMLAINVRGEIHFTMETLTHLKRLAPQIVPKKGEKY